MYELVDENDPILREPAKPFSFEWPEYDPKELAEGLIETMIKHRGVGIAAPQVGIPYQVMAVGNPDDKSSIMVFFNPKVVDIFGEMEYYKEGCLSFPDLFIKIRRPTGVRLRFTDVNNETTTTKYMAITARIIQHEYDHLQGVVFKDKATHYHLSQAKKHKRLAARRAG